MNLLELTLQGGVLIGAILLLRLLGRYRLPGWTFRILWGVALARLLIPVALPFPWNVYAGLERLADVGQAAQTAPGVRTPAEIPAPSQGGVIPEVPALPMEPGQIPVPEAAPAAVEIPWLTILYLAGAAVLALLFLVSYRRGVRVFRTALPLKHPAVNRWRRQIPALRGVPIRRCDRIRSPLTYGLIRPVVLLPKGMDCDQEEVGYILLHEGTHIRHGDAWWKLFLAAALCVHWFNPLVWCMYVWANRDLERCCDESVVRRCGLEARSEYVLTLLKWEERRGGLLPLCSNLGTPILKERVIFIMKLKKQSAAALALAAVLVLGTTAAFATSPAPERENQGRVFQDIQSPVSSGVQTPAGSSQVDEKPAAPIQTPAPETDTPNQVQTADPVTVSETENPQAPAEPQVPETQPPEEELPAPAEKWNLPANGDIGDGEAFAVANEAEYQTLASYLKEHYGLTDRDLHQRSNSDGTLTLRVSRATASSSEIESEWLENGDYKKNKYGETYGSSLLEYSVGYRPDLIAVIAMDTGASGFVDGTVMNGWYGYPYVNNGFPDDVGKYMDWLKTQPAERHLPVYDVDHKTVVGTYIMYNDQSENYVRTQEEIDQEIQMVTDMMTQNGYAQSEIDAYIQQMKADYAR